jgi:hypothetical protein
MTIATGRASARWSGSRLGVAVSLPVGPGAPRVGQTESSSEIYWINWTGCGVRAQGAVPT